MKIRPPNRPMGRVKSSAEVSRVSVDTMPIAATTRPPQASGFGVSRRISEGTATPAMSSANGTTKPAAPAAKDRSARTLASAGLTMCAVSAATQVTRPDTASEAAARMPPASPITAPGAVTPSVRSRR